MSCEISVRRTERRELSSNLYVYEQRQRRPVYLCTANGRAYNFGRVGDCQPVLHLSEI